jgi:hypothetical protein
VVAGEPDAGHDVGLEDGEPVLVLDLEDRLGGEGAGVVDEDVDVGGNRSVRISVPSAVPTSAATAPWAPRRAAACFAVVSVRPLTTTSAPAAMKDRAMASPIPAVEPVIRAVRPVRSMSIAVTRC